MSDSGRAKIMVLLLLAAVASWYWNHHKPASNTFTETKSTPTPAPAQPAPAQQETAYDNARDYARKYVTFAGVIEGRLEKPGLILKFDNRGDRDLSNITVQIIGYKEFYVQDPSKSTGTEYPVDLEVKNFPAKKVTETVLYFPSGVQSINRNITVYDARF